MINNKTNSKSVEKAFNLDPEEMVKAGVHFGHNPSNLHPKMAPFVHKKKKNVYLLDLEKTVEKFTEALQFIQKQAKEGKTILFVGTKSQHKKLVEKTAKRCGFPYVTQRWLGGILTNFGVLRDRIDYFIEFRQKINSSDFEKYTNKEQLDMKHELYKLKRKFGGIEKLEGIPDAVFICDLGRDDLAFEEARKKGVTVIGVCDSDVDPTFVSYPIFANDDAVSSMEYILKKVEEAIGEVKTLKELKEKEIKKPEERETKEKEKKEEEQEEEKEEKKQEEEKEEKKQEEEKSKEKEN